MKFGVNLEVRQEKGGRVALVFDPKQRNGRSASGKTTIVASSQGNQTIPTADGTVTVGVNVYVKE